MRSASMISRKNGGPGSEENRNIRDSEKSRGKYSAGRREYCISSGAESGGGTEEEKIYGGFPPAECPADPGKAEEQPKARKD